MRTKLMSWMLALFLVTGVASAADKSITLDTGDVVTLDWGADWVVGANPPESPPGTLTIHGADATQWRIVVGPLPPHPTLTADAGNLRMYVRWMARGLENGGAQVDEEQKPIEGRSARGLYFKAHDGRKKTKAQIRKVGGDFTDAYVGAMNVGSRPYVFEIDWIQGGEAAANKALTAVRNIRIK
jgi:hypothetical protein